MHGPTCIFWANLTPFSLQSLWARFRAPPKIKHVHCHRALVNIFLSLFAPLTRASMEMLICKSTCEGCADVYDDGAVDLLIGVVDHLLSPSGVFYLAAGGKRKGAAKLVADLPGVQRLQRLGGRPRPKVVIT